MGNEDVVPQQGNDSICQDDQREDKQLRAHVAEQISGLGQDIEEAHKAD